MFETLESAFFGTRCKRNQHRRALSRKPSIAAGIEHRGIKEVRLTAEHCHYLRWLYPKARFIFLYRNLQEGYRSYCRYGRSSQNVTVNWLERRPLKRAAGPLAAEMDYHW